MKFQIDENENISVILSREDMTELHITYEEMDYKTIETRRVIWEILEEAQRTLGTSLCPDERLLIQAAPSKDGGCLLLFSSLPQAQSNKKSCTLLKKGAEPILFCAFDLNAFIDVLTFLKRATELFTTYRLYKYNNCFYIVIYPEINSRESLKLYLSEYGETEHFNKKDVSKICEYGKSIKNLS